MGWVNEKEPEEVKHGNGMRKVVPEGYLESEVGRVRELTEKVMQDGADQGVINGVYEELTEVMKQSLVEVSGKKVRSGQPWFTMDFAK